jgi:hypothetical protein
MACTRDEVLNREMAQLGETILYYPVILMGTTDDALIHIWPVVPEVRFEHLHAT